jgi:hypothetical protein
MSTRVETGTKRQLKRSLRFLKKVHPLRPRFDAFVVPKQERSGMTEKNPKTFLEKS